MQTASCYIRGSACFSTGAELRQKSPRFGRWHPGFKEKGGKCVKGKRHAVQPREREEGGWEGEMAN